jgi:hypothetical protein
MRIRVPLELLELATKAREVLEACDWKRSVAYSELTKVLLNQ